METSGDWEMAQIRWVFGERGRETEDGEKGVDERRKGVVRPQTGMHETECGTDKMENGREERKESA